MEIPHSLSDHSARVATAERSVDRDEAAAFHSAVREHQQEALYPNLLTGSWTRSADVPHYRVRAGSDLIAVAVRHGALTPEQLASLGTFRAAQQLLWGFYEPAYFIVRTAAPQSLRDPALDTLASDTLHLVVGDHEGHILAYLVVHAPQQTSSSHSTAAGHVPDAAANASESAAYFTLGTPERPLFHCEAETFGPIFSTLPPVGALPLAQVHESSTFFRNAANTSPFTTLAVVEALSMIAQIQINPDHAIAVSLGCLTRSARTAVTGLGLPVLYAPEATVLYNNLAPYFSSEANEPGRFWPFLCATEDAAARSEYFAELDLLLGLPAEDLGTALGTFYAREDKPTPRASVPAPGSTSTLWTPDPRYVSGAAT